MKGGRFAGEEKLDRDVEARAFDRSRLKISTQNVCKLPKMSHFKFSILAFFIIFCLLSIGLSGNTV